MNPSDQYEVVVGLEVHAQLLTKSKLFCADSAEYGGEPNTHISPITLGHPGTLPKLNKQAVELAIKMGLACRCQIEHTNYFARKHYFYPDLPKGYQITQHTTPVCKQGFVAIKTGNGEKNIRLNRIHLEEDAGKSLHDVDAHNTCIDYNRAGVPLIEIVSEPDINSGEEAYSYLTELRKLVRYLDVCDGNMEEGSMRCDANISVRLKGDTRLGTKVEVKNLNSIRNVKRAIEYEATRLTEMLKGGQLIVQETRSFDDASGTTFTLREKEDANDYRYFPDPDLVPFVVTDEWLQRIKASIPPLQNERIQKYRQEYLLGEYDAVQLTEEKEVADYFEQVIQFTQHYKAAANWLLGPVKSYFNSTNQAFSTFNVLPKTMATLIQLVEEGVVNFSVASVKVLPELIKGHTKQPAEVIESLNLSQVSDSAMVMQWVEEVINKMPDKVSQYKSGKKGLIGLFVGEVKKMSKGKANPEMVTHLFKSKLD